MQVNTTGRGRLKGFLIYIAATAVVIAIHALALNFDEVTRDEPRVRTATPQA
ncbi:hypothetical protein HI806_09155 [Ralstonia solanacearum]|nr:hypothetical protein HI806_09155 [Ralstonia solanacearum]QKL76644.1 hypothetical protein HI805_09165 [Ralstonia solanacearum]QKL81848.1 hypothetical protein HI804_09165 [Ralstonia solanacearum]QKL87059.1 hypothetical protein HI803_09170 [Ralstonia solanacearum]QKM02425.1 hypothetical protein HI800_09165 [Ralstonia solanacearum]